MTALEQDILDKSVKQVCHKKHNVNNLYKAFNRVTLRWGVFLQFCGIFLTIERPVNFLILKDISVDNFLIQR